MKIFAIRDEYDTSNEDLAYLFYYENKKCFYIELPEDADPWKVPLILSEAVQKGKFTVRAHLSKIWVRQRVVPPDRQNIAQILRDNGLKCYDEYELMMLCAGRCEQDDYYLVPTDAAHIPAQIAKRFEQKVADAVPLKNNRVLVFFRSGEVRVCDLTGYFEDNQRFSILLKKPEYFAHIDVQPGGYGIEWDSNLSVTDEELIENGTVIPLSSADFRIFAKECIIDTLGAMQILGCTRQNVSSIVKSGKLCPLKSEGKNTLFVREDVKRRIDR